FAQAIVEELGDDPTKVKPTTTENFPRPAARPKNSVLSPKAWVEAGLTPLPPWRDALRKAFQAGLARPAQPRP
ncbi:sugar nucleotide-binding protein, partial [Kibdelosporangium lantanae]